MWKAEQVYLAQMLYNGLVCLCSGQISMVAKRGF